MKNSQEMADKERDENAQYSFSMMHQMYDILKQLCPHTGKMECDGQAVTANEASSQMRQMPQLS